MKKLFLLLALIVSSLTFAQAEFEKIAITENTKHNEATRLLVQDSLTKEVNWILKSSIAPSNVLHKSGDTFINSVDFDPLLSQDQTNLNILKRTLSPEAARFDTSLARIYGWGDSLTDGYSQVNYPTQLQGIYGYTVTNRGFGGETSTQIKDRLIAEPAAYSRSIIIWVGRNNIANPATIKADIATMISTVGHTRYLVVGVINGTNEPVGSLGYTQITSLNNDLKAIYGNKYVAIREFLVSNYNPSIPQDVIDHNNDTPPTSLHISGDPLHLNTAGYKLVAEFFNQRIGNMMDKNGYFQSKDFKYYLDLNGVMNLTTDQTFLGIKTAQSTGSAQNGGIALLNNGTGNSQVLYLGTTSSGRAATVDVSGTGPGFYINITSGTAGTYYRSTSSGQAISGDNLGVGALVSLNSVTGSTGNLFRLFKNGVATSIFDHNGILSTPSPIFTTVPVTSTVNYDFLTRNIATGQVEKVLSASIQPTITATTSADYYRGDKTMQPLNAAVINSTLTGYVSGAGAVSSTDTVLQAIQKLNGNNANSVVLTGNQTIAGDKTFTGDTTSQNLTISGANPVIAFSSARSSSLGSTTSIARIGSNVAIIGSPNTSNYGILFDNALLTSADRTYQFPNSNGVVALTSDIPSYGVKRYKALISQTGTSAPTVTILENTLGTVTYSYASVGSYTANSSGLFTSGKTFLMMNPAYGNGNVNAVKYNSSNVLDIKSNNGLTPTDGLLSNESILIEVYP